MRTTTNKRKLSNSLGFGSDSASIPVSPLPSPSPLLTTEICRSNNGMLSSNANLKRQRELDDIPQDCRPPKALRTLPLPMDSRLAMHFMSAVPSVSYGEARGMAGCAVAKLRARRIDSRILRITRGTRCCSGRFFDYHFAPKNPWERCNCARSVIAVCTKILARRHLYSGCGNNFSCKRRRLNSSYKRQMTASEYVAKCAREREQQKKIREARQAGRRLRAHRRGFVSRLVSISVESAAQSTLGNNAESAYDTIRQTVDRFLDTIGGTVDFADILIPQISEMAIDCKSSYTDTVYSTEYDYITVNPEESDDVSDGTANSSTVDKLAIVFKAAARIGAVEDANSLTQVVPTYL